MAFDRERFFRRAENGEIGSALVATADELAALHAEIEALKAAMPAPKREMGWAVVNMPGVPGRGPRQFMTAWGFFPDCRDRKIMWFRSISDVESCVRALWDGGHEHVRPALLYKDTLEEVENA